MKTTSPTSGMYMMAASSAIESRAPGWSGFYIGAEIGLASLSTNDQINDTGTFMNVSSGFSQSQQNTNIGQAGGRAKGALADLSLGYNWQLGTNFVGGLQIDGSLSNLSVRESGTFNGTFTSSGSFGGGTSTSTTTSNPTDVITNRWLVSALARAGWLILPQDLFYLTGGWTYGSFESSRFFLPQTFGLQGPTIGGGVEIMVGWGWTIKAEYRYTKFLDKNLNFGTASQSSSPGSLSGGTGNESSMLRTQMQTILIGASRYFDTY
jgi:outer membrane immunogenic protein